MFTDRENEIADLYYAGFTRKEIAEKLFLSDATVATHTLNLYQKENVHNINQFLALKIKELQVYKAKWEYLRERVFAEDK